MQVITERVAGLDVHKKTVTGCARTPDERPGKDGQRRSRTKTLRTFAKDLEALRDWLASQGVTLVAMEATGVYWKPVWYALEGHFELMLVNPRHVKRVPGRKADVTDAQWLARLAECGLLSASFVPPPQIRELRDLTRHRTRLVQQRASEVQRIDKLAEDTGIKLGSVASNTLGVSGRSMLEALIAGESDPDRGLAGQRPAARQTGRPAPGADRPVRRAPPDHAACDAGPRRPSRRRYLCVGRACRRGHGPFCCPAGSVGHDHGDRQTGR